MQIAQGWDWGTIPAWFSAILSGGSVLLALYIILRDRKKAERADATQVVCWTSIDWEADDFRTHVHNTSDRAIHDLMVWAWLPPEQAPDAKHTYQGFPMAPVLRPGEETDCVVERWHKYQSVAPEAITYIDSDGQSWLREIRTGRVHARGPRRFDSRSRWRNFAKTRRHARHIRRIVKRRSV
ncbi:hypothetical protein OG763_09905 [Streptomyces sp. NBC_01230]|uniref:hypothetical protein n=1 Tax=Streptomyces sp. NBC_01230 TaxID=2903784 RepID=UPI002E159B0D|nr:hypothetical protein OG763_09905 [Streptomyces sp. NBC_01230]